MIMLYGPSGRLIVGMHIVCYNRWGHLEHVFEALDTYSEIEVIAVIVQIAPVLAQKASFPLVRLKVFFAAPYGQYRFLPAVSGEPDALRHEPPGSPDYIGAYVGTAQNRITQGLNISRLCSRK